MKRRDFLISGAAMSVVPMSALAETLEYEPGLLKKRQKAGEVVFIDFKTSWCSTCRAQGRIIDALKAENPDYEKNITFINVDWDIYGESRMAGKLKIPRRSTLVAFDGKKELGRIVAETREDKIRALMDAALAAAVSS